MSGFNKVLRNLLASVKPMGSLFVYRMCCRAWTVEDTDSLSLPLLRSVFARWYFQGFSKVDAEQHLGQCSDDGTFLIRPSQTVAGEYSISVRDKDLVKHYRIQQRDDPPYKYYLSQQAYFDHVSQLVEFYQHNTGTGGLRLRDPAPLTFHTDV